MGIQDAVKPPVPKPPHKPQEGEPDATLPEKPHYVEAGKAPMPSGQPGEIETNAQNPTKVPSERMDPSRSEKPAEGKSKPEHMEQLQNLVSGSRK